MASTPPSGQPPAPVERPHPLTAIVKTWILLVAVALWFLRELDFTATWIAAVFLPALGVIGAVAAVQLGFGLLSWRYTRFVADVDELRVERNFVWHTSDKIPYTKVQSVDVLQPFAARLLGLAKVHIDVGGGGGKDIEFLARRRAYDLRDYVISRAHGQIVAGQGQPQASPAGESAEAVFQDVFTQDEVLVRTRKTNLILGAVFSATFVLVTIVGFLIGYLGMAAGRWATWWPLIVAVGGLLARTISSWNSMLIRTERGLKVTRGLTTLTSQSLPRDRVQGIHISQPLLWRIPGLWKLQITVLGYGLSEAADATSNIVVPAGPWSDVEVALQAIWPGFQLENLQWSVQPEPAKWLTWFGFRRRAWALDHQVVATRRGVLTQVIDLVPYARIQSVKLGQGPLQRKLDLARIQVQISMGPVFAEIGYLQASVASAFTQRLTDLGRWARANDLELKELLALEAPKLEAPAQETATSHVTEGPPPEPISLLNRPVER